MKTLDYGIVTIHGFTGYPEEMEPLGKFMEENGLYWKNVLLPGHAKNPEELREYRWSDWANKVMEEIEEAKQNVEKGIFVAGLSLGGLLTLYSLIHDKTILGGITLAAPIRVFKWYHDVLSMFPIGFWVKNQGDPETSLNDPQFRDIHRAYEYFHSDNAKDVNNLAKHVRKRLQKIEAPILIVHSKYDKLVEVSNAYEIFEKTRSKHKYLFLVNRSSHVLTRDYDREIIFSTALNFINEVNKR